MFGQDRTRLPRVGHSRYPTLEIDAGPLGGLRPPGIPRRWAARSGVLQNQTLFTSRDLASQDPMAPKARYSMTSSARASTVSGTLMPSAVAAFRLRISSTLDDC